MGVEEEESLAKGKGVVVGRRRAGLVAGHRLGDDNGEGDDGEEEEEGPESPLEEPALAHDAPQIHVLVLDAPLLLGSQKPALLHLVQAPTGLAVVVVVVIGQRSLVPVHVAVAPVVSFFIPSASSSSFFSSPVDDLERASPVVRYVHLPSRRFRCSEMEKEGGRENFYGEYYWVRNLINIRKGNGY